MKKLFLMLLFIATVSPVISQSYSQSTGQVCGAYYTTYRTFTGTPETTVDAVLSFNWLYCGPNYNDANYGNLDIYIIIDGDWVTIADMSDSGHGCSWVSDEFVISAANLNAALNSNGGNVEIAVSISDGCASGYGCNYYSDPCFNATLSYTYAPIANFSVDNVSTCIDGEVIFTNTTQGPQETYEWDFGVDAVPSTAYGIGPHAVYWTSGGGKDISLSVDGNGDTSQEIKVAYVDVANAPSSIVFGDAFEVWQNKINENSIQTQKSIIDDDDNSYITGIYSGSGNDIWLSKIDSDGNTIWSETYVNSGNENVNDIILDSNNDIYLCGSSSSDYLIMKVNADGSLAWMEVYDVSGNADEAHALCIDNSGSIYVTGETYAANGTDVTTVKYDNDGNYQFELTEADSGTSSGEAIEWKDGFIYVFGTINSSGFNEDMLLVKYETQLGIQQWVESINGSGYANDQGLQMILDGTDLYLMGKNAQSGGAGWTVAKYDLDGNEDWIEDYFTGDTDFGTYEAMAIDGIGNVYLASSKNDGGDDFMRVLQLNSSDGSQNWFSDFSAINDTQFRSIETASNGTIYVSGITENNSGNLDLCVEQIGTDGVQFWWAVYDGCGNTTDDAIDLRVDSNNEAIVAGHNIQALAIKFGALIEPSADFSLSANEDCVGQTVIFTDQSEGSALNYSWYFGDDAVPGDAFGPGPHEVIYETGGVKTVNLTITNGLGNSEVEYDVEIFELPEITTTVDTEICFGNSTTIQATGTGSISWDNGLGDGASFDVSPEENTTYTATTIDENQCTASTSVIVTVNELPTADAGDDQTICNGEIAVLNASGSGEFMWDNGIGDDESPEVSPNEETTYTLTVQDENLCENEDEVTVFVNELPNADAGDDVEICFGFSTVIEASGGDEYSWDNGLGAGSVQEVEPSENTLYTVTVTNADDCSAEAEVFVTVNVLPEANAGDDAQLCSGGSFTLFATGGSSYTWDNDLGAGASHDVSPEETTIYSVVVLNEFDCESTDEMILTVLESPIAEAGEDAEICLGDSYTLIGSGGSSYDWEGVGEGQSIEIEPESTDSYLLTVTANNNCSDTDELTVTVNLLPNVNAGEDQEICNGETVTLHAVGGETYEWDNGIGEGQTQEVEPTDNTIYIVTATDLNLCQNMDTVMVIVNPLPAANAGPDQEICPGETTTISASGGEIYEWDEGLGEGQSHDVTPESSTLYTVTVFNEFDCSAEDAIEVVVYPIVNLSIDGLSDTPPYCFNYNNVYTLVGTPSGGTFSGLGVSGNDYTPSNAELGFHDITYEFSDENACDYSMTVEVEVVICLSVDELESSFNLYPNPTSGIVYVQSSDEMVYDESDIYVIDVQGQVVQVEVEKTQSGFSIDMAGIAKGVYFVRIQNDVIEFVKSVVVE